MYAIFTSSVWSVAMKRFLLVLVLVAVCHAIPPPDVLACLGATSRFQEAVVKFSHKFLQKTYQADQTNPTDAFVCSPVSPMLTAAALSYFTKTGSATQKQLLSFLNVDDVDQLTCGTDQFIELVKKQSPEVQLSFNRYVFIKKQYQITDDFRDTYKKVLGFTYPLDFSDSSAAKKIINNYVKKDTKGKISNIFSSNFKLQPDSKSFALTAVSLTVKWENGFDTDKTFDGPFYLGNNETIQIKYNKKVAPMKYIDSDKLGAKIAELNSAENGLKVIVIVPNKDKNLDTVLEAIQDTKIFKAEMNKMKSVRVEAMLPARDEMVIKNRIASLNIIQDLNLINNIFDEKTSNFKGIVEGDKPFAVNEGIHAVRLEPLTGSKAPTSGKAQIKLDINAPFLFSLFYTDKSNNYYPIVLGIRRKPSQDIMMD